MIGPATLVAIVEEAERAHEVHGPTSMRSKPPGSDERVSVIVEELGEIGRVLNDARHGHCDPDWGHLHEELVQLAAMAADWAETVAPLID